MISNLRLAWLLSYIATASVSAAVITPSLPLIERQFNLQLGSIEWMVTAFLIGYVIGQLIYAPLANCLGRLVAMRIGLTINLVGLLICFAGIGAHAYWLLILGRLVTALGAASGLAYTFMLINEWLPDEQRRTAMAYSILSFTLGIGLAVSLGGLITEYWEWQGCFVLLLIHGLVMFFGTWALKETLIHPQPIQIKTIFSGYKNVLSSPGLLVFALVVGFCSAIGYCFSAAGPQIAEQLLHLSAGKYGTLNLLNMVGMLAGGLWAKQLLAKVPAQKMVSIGFIGCAFGILCLIVMQSLGYMSTLWFFLTTMILYVFSGLLFAGGSYLASSAVTDKGNGSAMLSFINMSTATLAVMVMGYLSPNPMIAFIEILSVLWVCIVVLLIIYSRSSVKKSMTSS